MAGGGSRAEKKSLLALCKPRSTAALSEPGLNGSTGDPDPALSGKQQASVTSWCYYWSWVINTSAILRGKWCVVAGSAGGQGTPFCERKQHRARLCLSQGRLHMQHQQRG